MDPVSAIGLAGALVGIGDVLTRSIRSLVGLQSKYRSSSLVVSLLIGQLTTLKAALNQITEFVTGSLINVSLHEQLVGDLQVSLESCHVLIYVLEERIQGLEREDDESDGSGLSTKGKAKFLLEESTLNEFNNYLSSQVNALNLLLTALNCRTTFERAELLHNDESRRIFKRVDDNRTSLLTLRDAESQYTRMSTVTENLSLLDLDFDFDQEVLTSDVYRAAWRSNLRKDAMRKGKLPQRGSIISEVISEVEEPERIVRPQIQPNGKIDFHSAASHTGIDLEVLGRVERFGLRNESPFDARDNENGDDTATPTPPNIEEEENLGVDSLAAKSLELPPLTRAQKTEREAKRSEKTIWKLWSPRQKIFTFRGNIAVPAASRYQALLATLVNIHPAEQKVLLLGGSESGKSTFLKTAKLVFEGGYSRDERESFKEIIFSNTVQSMRVILEAMDWLELPVDDQRTQYHVQTIIMQPANMEGDNMPAEVGRAIDALWKDSGVREAFERSREYQLCDNAAYYFNSIDRIAKHDYVATDSDILMSRVKTTGTSETSLLSSGGMIRVFDHGGTRSERKKWIHSFEKVDVIIFHVDIASYDQLLFEDETVNRMREALTVFDSIVNSRWFITTSFLLHFTKMDKLEDKIKKSPFKKYFPDFEKDGENIDDVKADIESRFLSLNQHPEKSIQVVYTSFIDGYEAGARKVFDSITGRFHET